MNQRLDASIKKLTLLSKKLTHTTLSGDYLSAFKGAGLHFHQLRDYQFGDDQRTINWSSSLKMGKLMVKQFIEEKERTLMLLIDVSASMRFSSKDQLKSELLSEITSFLATLALQHNDAIGAVFFSDQIEAYIPPHKGIKACSAILQKLSELKARCKKSSLACALSFLVSLKKHTMIVFALGDFLDNTELYENTLRLAAKKHDFIAVRILDEVEKRLPFISDIVLEDPETGVQLSCQGKRMYRFLEKTLRIIHVQHNNLFRKLRIDYIDCSPQSSFLKPLTTFFHKRMKRR